MEEHDILQYQACWQDHNLYCLGPIPEEYAGKYFNEESRYCVYDVLILSYSPVIIHGIDMVNAVVDRMLDAGIKIIDQDDIDRQRDLSRLWGDRKHEFSLKPKMTIHQQHKYDYIIHHKPSKRGISPPTSREERYEIIKK